MGIRDILKTLSGLDSTRRGTPTRRSANSPSNVAGTALPLWSEADRKPVPMTTVQHPDGRLSQYPPAETWNDWVEWDARAWPEKIARRYTLVPTICFNCEAACGLLAYVDKTTFEIRKFEGNPVHPGSRGRNCAKGPATLNQTYDPERILYPLKRVGARGAGQWKRITWDEALGEISSKMRESRLQRRDGIVYHVGRPGEDGYTERCVTAWGVDGHNSHTNICSSSARVGYYLWSGFDRPSPDHANARVILLISSHLETGHYFNPHAQRIIEGKNNGAKLIVMDPRLSNTASRSDVWLPTWPGSESTVLLSIARYLLHNDLYDREFLRRWVNWREFLDAAPRFVRSTDTLRILEEHPVDRDTDDEKAFRTFELVLKSLYSEFTFERAAAEAQVPRDRLEQTAKLIADCGGRLAAHVWRAAATGNLGGWQVGRCLFLLNVLTGSVGVPGGTYGNTWNKLVPKPFASPDPVDAWNRLHFPHEYPLACYEMSFLLPHFLQEGRGSIDVYFTRVYNPMWTNPDGFLWHQALTDEQKIRCHVALTPTWSETAWFADYVLPMGHAGERHDLQSQETHNSQWIGFRQPVRRVAMERAGMPVRFTYEANPGLVWEENEWWIELSARMDPDGSLGIRRWFESPYRPGEIITVDEYYRWIFENSVPGLPASAAREGLTPLEYMRKYGCFEVKSGNTPYDVPAAADAPGVEVDGDRKRGFETPSRRLELYSPIMTAWGWTEQEYVVPWNLPSHVGLDRIDRSQGEMLLLPTFRLPTLIHTRSANAKWLYEISHKNPLWVNPEDAERLGVGTNDLLRVETEIGHFVDRVWVTEGIKPGVIACSHHLGRWRLQEDAGVSRGMSSLARLEHDADGKFRLDLVHGARAWKSFDPDTSRVWWDDVGVHQNLTHAVHPDPVSGGHCWHQKVVVKKALATDRHGDVAVDTKRSMQAYREWLAMTRPAETNSPDGTRRARWFKRPVRVTADAYKLPRA